MTRQEYRRLFCGSYKEWSKEYQEVDHTPIWSKEDQEAVTEGDRIRQLVEENLEIGREEAKKNQAKTTEPEHNKEWQDKTRRRWYRMLKIMYEPNYFSDEGWQTKYWWSNRKY